MLLQPGARLGPYEILSLLGAGGMGEVYKGRDTRLDRIVALKVLAPHLVDNPEARERFEREARTVANLRHPNICVLYDIGHEGGIHFLVLEYLEGETLAQRIAKSPLPLVEVLKYATEIADAMDTAHHAGVTHRDIKPGNIMLSGGSSKLLDFGLAKLKQGFVSDLPRSEWPTGMGAPTVHGTVLGTLQYMAPEQAEGKVDELDARTDIFAFGAVVYEAVTGKKAFEGSSPASVMAAILKEDPPPMSSLQPLTPPLLDRVVKKCLAKAPEKRWQRASDLHDELEWIAAASAQPATPQPVVAPTPAPVPVPLPAPVQQPRLSWQRALVGGLGLLVLGALISGVAVWYAKPSLGPRSVSRLVVTSPPNVRLAGLNFPAVALSPDGSQLVYVGATAGGVPQLYLRALDSLEAKPIPGTEGAQSPFFSPDGQWVGFFAVNALKKVSISGGAAVTLCSVAVGEPGASWGPNDIIVFHSLFRSALWQVPAAGGTPKAFSTLKGETGHHWPEFLPGGKAVLFAAITGGNTWDDAQILVQGFPTGERKVLVQGGTNPHYAPSGHLVFVRAGTLMVAPFDLSRLEVTGPPVPILEGVMESGGGVAQFSVSNRGSLVYVPGSFLGNQSRLVWVDRKGSAQPLPAPPRDYGPPRLSPDGRRIAVLSQGNVWVYDIGRDTLTRLTFERSSSLLTAWTPDGKRVTFQALRGGDQGLFWKPADGSGTEERLTASTSFVATNSWSPDGQVLAFHEVNPSTGADIWVLPLEGDPSAGSPRPSAGQAGQGRKPRPFLRTPFNEAGPTFSPDGRWLAYISDESGRLEVYVQPFPGPGGKWQISTEGGIEPIWGRNGEIFYRNGDKMMAVETNPSRDSNGAVSFSAGKPRLLFEGQYIGGPGFNAGYDVAADGQRFLMLKGAEQEQAATQINVVLNWFEELKRRVPTK